MLITGVIIEEEDARKNTPQKTQKTTKGSTAEVTLGLHITLHFLQSTFILLGWGFFFSLGFFYSTCIFQHITLGYGALSKPFNPNPQLHSLSITLLKFSPC